MRIGIGIGMPKFSGGSSRRVAAEITSPAPATEFLVGVATAVSGTSSGLVGLTIEASFRSDFSVICGTSGVIPGGGAWSLNATAIAGDLGETILYVRPVGGSAALATLACTVVPGVAFSSPAPGTTFITDTATSVSLTGYDGVYETSWQSDFATTNGEITVSSGTGSGNVTPAWSDGIASPERATLYVRRKSIGGAALASQSAPIWTGWDAAVTAAADTSTLVLHYDFDRTGYYTESGGLCTSATPQTGGTAADVLIPGGGSGPPIGAITKLGGRKGIIGNSSAYLLSTTPLSALVTSQPFTEIDVGVHGSSVNFYRSVGGAISAANCTMVYDGNGGPLALFAGTATVDSAHSGSTALGSITRSTFNGASSAIEYYLTDGTHAAGTVLAGSPGTFNIRGYSLLARYDGAYAGDWQLSAKLRITGMTAQCWTNILTLANISAARGGCAASIPL